MSGPRRSDDMQGRKFRPIGKCIYCGSDGGALGLEDEHIIPFSLDGDAILKKASCRECARITSFLEGYLARHVYYDFRLHYGAQSRRKQPTRRYATVVTGAGQKRVELNIQDHPHFLNLPVWGRPGLMYAEQPTDEFKEVAIATFFNVPTTAMAASNVQPNEKAEILNDYSINLETFSRAIAKIAYCSMIATIGLDNFRPLYTPAIILGRYPYPSHFVGCRPFESTPPDEAHKRHSVEYGLYVHDRLTLAMMSVRLFADCGNKDRGMPTYEVLVGAPRPESLRILQGLERPILTE